MYAALHVDVRPKSDQFAVPQRGQLSRGLEPLGVEMDEYLLSAELNAGNIKLPLKQPHRDAMLDLVLVWAALDGAIAMLLATIMGKPYHEAADLIGRQRGSCKLSAMIKLLRRYQTAGPIVTFLKKHKRKFEKFSVPRNRIAHARCAGYLASDENYIVFLVFERDGDNGMAVEAVPLDELERARRWGEAFSVWIIQTLDKLSPTK